MCTVFVWLHNWWLSCSAQLRRVSYRGEFYDSYVCVRIFRVLFQNGCFSSRYSETSGAVTYIANTPDGILTPAFAKGMRISFVGSVSGCIMKSHALVTIRNPRSSKHFNRNTVWRWGNCPDIHCFILCYR
jgi:hypothetical protein